MVDLALHSPPKSNRDRSINQKEKKAARDREEARKRQRDSRGDCGESSGSSKRARRGRERRGDSRADGGECSTRPRQAAADERSASDRLGSYSLLLVELDVLMMWM